MQIKENRKWSREGEKITWHEGWWLLSSVVAGGGGDGVGDDGFHQFFPCFPYLSLFFSFCSLLSPFFSLSVLSSLSLFCFSLLSLYSSLFFSFSCCSLSLPLFSSFSAILLSFFLFFSILSSALLFLVLSPVFIRKIGEKDRGGHCAASPRTTRGTHLLPLLQHVESFEQVEVVSVPF
jgi:hypothetical protein